MKSKIISKRSRNNVFLVYEKDLVNEELLQTIKDKLASFDTDAILDLSILEQYIEERPRSIFPTILYTERPDRAASFIEEGHIVLLMENSPSCLDSSCNLLGTVPFTRRSLPTYTVWKFHSNFTVYCIVYRHFYLFILYCDYKLSCRDDSS